MRRIIIWLIAKLALAGLLIGLGLTVAGLWVFLREPGAFNARQQQDIEQLKAEQLGLKAALVNLDGRMLEARTQVSAQQLRAEQSAKVARELDELGSGLNWLTTNSDQLRENEQRLVRMKQMEADSLKRVVELGHELTRLQWEKDGLEIAVQRSQARLNVVAEEKSAWLHYARLAWAGYGKIVMIAAGVVMLGLPVWRFGRGR